MARWITSTCLPTTPATVDTAIPALRARLHPDGMIWVSWPKKAFESANRRDRGCHSQQRPAAGCSGGYKGLRGRKRSGQD